jgi:hypothetical protein
VSKKRLLGGVRRVGLIAAGLLAGLAAGWMVGELVGGTKTLASPQAESPAAAAQPGESAEAAEAAPRHHPGADINPTGETMVIPTRQAPKDGPPEEKLPAAQTAAQGDGLIRSLPHIVIDRREKTVTLEGVVVLREGMLELFVCAAGMRQHESIVHVEARPLNIQLALLLLGLKSGNTVSWTADGEFLPAAGPEMRVFVEYEKDGKAVRVEAHEWMVDALDQPVKPQRWVFAGGAMHEDQFLADIEGTVVCVSNFSSAILDLPFESTAVNDQLIYKARTEAIPPPGTRVRVILQPTGKVIEGKKLVWVYVIDKDNRVTLEGQPSSPEDLAKKLEGRDKYLKKVEIYAHPRSQMEHTFAAMKTVSGFTGLQMQVLPLMEVEDQQPAGDKPTDGGQ